MNPLLARYLYFSLQFFRREPVRKALEIQSMFFDENTIEFELDFKKKFLINAKNNVPFYNKEIEKNDIHIEKISSVNEINYFIESLPIIEKQYVIRNKEKFLSKFWKQKPYTLNTTSGSTGDPLIFPLNNESWAFRHAAQFYCLSKYGINIGEPYGYFFGQHWRKDKKRYTDIKDLIFNRIRVSAFNISDQTVVSYFAQLKRSRITHIIGYPSAISDFCNLISKKKDLQELGIKGIVTTSEPLFDYQRETIEKAFKAPCINIYGAVEAGIVAFEIPDHGLIQNRLGVHVKEVDNEIIATDIHNYSFPLINFRTGDYFEPGEKEGEYSQIFGRSGKKIELKTGRTINANVFSYIFKTLSSSFPVAKYRFYLSPEKGSFRCEVVMIDVPSNIEVFQLELRNEFVQSIGNDIPLEISLVEEIPYLANAKHRDIVEL
ncbi:MAG: hypothetical protein LPK80_11890, partial [Bacteroidota bacterium]|nr:hypothetical protein [Bacteroidota bacterium]